MFPSVYWILIIFSSGLLFMRIIIVVGWGDHRVSRSMRWRSSIDTWIHSRSWASGDSSLDFLSSSANSPFSKGPLMSLASLIGSPIRIDAATKSLSRPSIARVCVEVNLLCNLPKRVWIGHGDNGFWQSVTYEALPSYCTTCSQLGYESGNYSELVSHSQR